MNPMDILGGLLGKRTRGSSGGGGGGLGGSILESILKGGGRRTGAPSGSSRGGSAQRPAGSPQIIDSGDSQEFDSLEDLLRHAHTRHSGRMESAQRQRQPERQRFPDPEPQIAQRQTEFTAEYEGNPDPFNENAQVLVIAMINAAKADGRIDQAEQDAIIKQLGELSQDEVQFLRSEFAKPLNISEFVASVPIGMEQQVYAISLMAIELDQNSEAQYLRELGKGFRMSLDQCNRIHQEFNAPQLRG